MHAALAFLGATLLIATNAHGEDELGARGLRVKFGEGVALEAVGRWADALDRFGDIARVRPTPEVEFHVGLCLDRLGRLRQADRAYREARDRGWFTAPLVVSEANERLRDLDARMPRVTVGLDGDSRNVTILLDGERVDGGVVQRLDAGPHVAIAARNGVPLAAVAFSTQERRSRQITLRVLIRPIDQAARDRPIARATASR